MGRRIVELNRRSLRRRHAAPTSVPGKPAKARQRTDPAAMFHYHGCKPVPQTSRHTAGHGAAEAMDEFVNSQPSNVNIAPNHYARGTLHLRSGASDAAHHVRTRFLRDKPDARISVKKPTQGPTAG
jgi:hypothetical protein